MSANDHGSQSTYNNYHCRCEPCREANTVYWRGFYARNRERVNKYVRDRRAARKAEARS